MYSIADGLPQNTVFSIAQDAQGFIWLNAGQHLTRFDGASFQSHTNYTHPVFNRNREGFGEMQADGDLLVYCLNGQIASTNTLTGEESFVPVAGQLPAGYGEIYGHCVKLETGEIVAIYPAEAAGKVALLWLEKGKITRLLEVSGVNADRSNFYYTFHGDAHGNLYFLGNGFDAVLKFDRNGKQLQAFPIENTENQAVIRILPGRGNSVLLVIENDIFRLEQGADAFRPHPANQLIQIGTNSIYDLAETPDGNFWAACSQRHLLFYDAKLNKVFDYNNELERLIQNQTTLVKMYSDKSGAIWISTTVGILRLVPNNPFFDTYFTEQNALCGGYCSFRGFAEDGSGVIYASFYNNIFKINGPKDRHGNYAGLLRSGDFGPFDLLFYKGNLLLNSGTILDQKTGLMTKPFPNTPHTHDWGVFAKDAGGNTWWATGSKVFVLDDPNGSPAWKEIASIPEQGNIADIAFDAHKGLLWFGNEVSLWALDPVTRKLERHGENQPDFLSKLKCIYPDGKGAIWLGTEKGLVRYEYGTDKLRRYSQTDGLPNDIVVGILPEGDSCLWLSTYNGLSRFSTQSGRFLNFYKKDGLADNEFNRASHFTASDGRMYFGGVKGVTVFYPKQVMADFAKLKTAEKLLLRGITLTEEGSDGSFTQLFPNAAQPLQVYHRNRTINFDFGLLSSTGNTLYSYMLDGLNETWSTPTQKNDLTFNSLPAGKYTFRVRAMDARGNWLADEIAVPLIVHPPWWASWWACLCYALVLAGIAYGIFYFLKKRWELQGQLALEQREAMRLKELDSFKSRLFTNITHEFRTPLAVILGMAGQGKLEIGKLEKLDIGDSTAQLQTISNFLISNFNSIERNGQNLLRLINQLLDLAKLEDKSFQLNLQHGDIVPYLRYVVESFHSYANVHNLSLRFFTTVDQLGMDFDPEQIQQVMGNLLSNAIKFTPSGGEIKVNLRFPNSQLLISVSDTGIGIPEADLPHIFDRFYQVDGSSTRRGEGTGIGLAHTQELVRLMAGEIAVDSKIGEGSTFTLRLPVRAGQAAAEQAIQPFDQSAYINQAAQPPPAVPGQDLATQPDSAPGRPSLLLMEDNPDVVDYLKTILAPDYQLDMAFNGRIGVEKALETIPDLIISDVMMPEKDGYQVLDTLKNDLRTSHIPILLLTAKADAASKLAGLRRGADAYLPKPFVKAELFATLEMMMENKRRMLAFFAAQFGQAVPKGESATVEAAIEIEDAFLQKVRQAVAENFADEGFALPQLCEKIGMSRSQLFRKLKALIDESPSDFIRNYRMQQAKTLLETTPLSVKEVAFKVGFKDVPHFSRTFQEAFGVPPSATGK